MPDPDPADVAADDELVEAMRTGVTADQVAEALERWAE